MKKEASLKRQGAQKIPDEKRSTFKMLRSSKRSSMKKEAPLKHQGAKKDTRQKKMHPQNTKEITRPLTKKNRFKTCTLAKLKIKQDRHVI
jgi:hypothetical protein